jgi:hypothetical protein
MMDAGQLLASGKKAAFVREEEKELSELGEL